MKINNPNVNSMLFPEIFLSISNMVGNTNKANLIKEYRSSVHGNALTTLIFLIYNSKLEYRLPEGEPPYKINDVPIGTTHTILTVEHKHLYRFVKGGHDALPQRKVEDLYIQLLESLHPSEADLLIRIFNRSFETIWKGARKYNIPFDAIKLAYPEILWSERKSDIVVPKIKTSR
jgi:hypothetical protein